jgi:hypothetical protein
MQPEEDVVLGVLADWKRCVLCDRLFEPYTIKISGHTVPMGQCAKCMYTEVMNWPKPETKEQMAYHSSLLDQLEDRAHGRS